ncbi:hypothetical protein Ddc_03779 [Ditylenchus destructor]|nr:hypothetical protein Ddc_03779 [Ditylenchus destructor]
MGHFSRTLFCVFLIIRYSNCVKIAVSEEMPVSSGQPKGKDDIKSYYTLLMEADISGKMWFGENKFLHFSVDEITKAERVMDNGPPHFLDFQVETGVIEPKSKKDIERTFKRYDVPWDNALIYKNKGDGNYVQLNANQQWISGAEYHLKVEFMPHNVFTNESIIDPPLDKNDNLKILKETSNSSISLMKRVDAGENSTTSAINIVSWPKEWLDKWELHILFGMESYCEGGSYNIFKEWKQECRTQFISKGFWIKSTFMCPPEIGGNDYRKCTFIWSGDGENWWSTHWGSGLAGAFECSDTVMRLRNDDEGIAFHNLKLAVRAKLEQPEFPPGQGFERCQKDRSTFYFIAKLWHKWISDNVLYIICAVLLTGLGIWISKRVYMAKQRRQEMYAMTTDPLWGIEQFQRRTPVAAKHAKNGSTNGNQSSDRWNGLENKTFFEMET